METMKIEINKNDLKLALVEALVKATVNMYEQSVYLNVETGKVDRVASVHYSEATHGGDYRLLYEVATDCLDDFDEDLYLRRDHVEYVTMLSKMYIAQYYTDIENEIFKGDFLGDGEEIEFVD